MRFSPWSWNCAVTTLLLPLLPLLPSCSYGTPAEGLSLNRRATREEFICSWDRPQSALFRDTIFLDGGALLWQVTGEDGKTTSDPKSRQQLYYLNLTRSFTISDGRNAIKNISKPDSNMGTDFKNGFMLANDYEFIVYGGYMDFLDKDLSVGPGFSLARDLVQNGATPLKDPPKYRNLALSGVTRYIAAGGSVNVPSENRAYVFSGATGRNWSEFYTTATTTNDLTAVWNSTNLISVDMSTMGSEKWSNKTFPSSIPARKNAEVVWLPVGSQGTLVIIGGALNRDSVRYRLDVTAEQKAQGQGFVENVHLYDIANDRWYTQATTGDKPPAMSEFCTVVAPSQDGKSFQIYAYGGWGDFTSIPTQSSPASANVYVLSLPSFQWIKVYDGKDANHGRKGHRCHKVADNLMMVVGGQLAASGASCINGGIIRLFNLNKLTWEDKYDPAVYDVYKVPDVISKVVGGTETGGADVVPTTWNDSAIPELFNVKYTKTVKNWWPYPSVSGSTTTTPSGTVSVVPSPNSNSIPKYIPPLLGSILGLLGLIIFLSGILFCLRRKRQQRKRLQSDSAASTVRKNRHTWSWLMGVHGDEKHGHEWADPSAEPSPFGTSAIASPMTEVQTNPIETAGQELYEMPNNTIVHELYSGPPQRRVTINDGVTEIRGGDAQKPPLREYQPQSSPSPSSGHPTSPRTEGEEGQSVRSRLLYDERQP